MRDALDIDSSGGDVGGHEDVIVSIPEAVHRPIPLVLGHVALQADRSMPILSQFFRQLSCSPLCPCEDDGGIEIILTDEMAQYLELELLDNRIESVFDGLCRHRVIDLGDERIDQDLFCQFAELIRHGGPEEQVLTLLRKRLEDSSDVGEETHVEHVIRFVEDRGPNRL